MRTRSIEEIQRRGLERHIEQMRMDDENFEKSESCASSTYPMQCSALRKNGFVVIKNRPCKIVEMSTSKTGKHGHAKVHMVGIDIFTNKKYEDLCPSTHNMLVPAVDRKEYQLTNITDDDFLELMDEVGVIKADLKLPEGVLGKEIKEKFDNDESILVVVQTAMGFEAAITCKNMQEGK